jgi:uncharacterized protein RhaS with RHS repeats
MEFYYNISGQLAAVMDTMGRMINFEYYPFEKETDENGVPEGRFKAISGRLKTITDFDSRKIEFKYYEDSGDLKEVDFMGRVKKYVYVTSAGEDIKLSHNLEKIIDPIGAATDSPVLTITYDGNDKVVRQDFIELDNDIIFNIGDSVTTVTDAKGHSKVFTFTGNTHWEVTNGGYTTKYDFNDDGLLTQIEFPEGNKIIYTYDTSNKNRRSQGNLVDVTSTGNDGSITISYGYESYFNQITGITDAKQNSTTIIRDGNGNIDEVNAPGIPAYDYDFNKYGQLEKVTDPMGSVTEYTYYPESSPSGDGNRTISAKVLDDTTGGYLEKVILDKGGDNISQNFVYNSIGNITNAVNGEGVTTIYGYEDENGNRNPFGEVLTLTQGATGANDGQLAVNLVTNFTYDKNGNVKERISRGVTTTYTYDRLNRPRFVKHNGGSGEEQILQEYEYIYDNNSNLTDIIYPKGNRDTFTYNDRDLLFNKILGNELTTETYTYTPNGYLHILTDGEKKDYTYVHDSHGRLKDIIDPLGNKVSMGYDANSNVTSVDGTGIDGKTFTQGFDFDKLNRLTHHRIQKEVGFITTKYGYNHSGYLQSVTTPNNYPWGITPTGSGLTH